MASSLSSVVSSRLSQDSNPTCRVCGSQIFTTVSDVFDTRFGIENYYNIGLCKICGLEQTCSIPSITALRSYYDKYYNYNEQATGRYNELRHWFLQSVFHRIWTFVDGDITFLRFKKSGKLIDIGCNEGRGLAVYKKNGFEVEGLEPNTRAAEKARKKGYTVHTEPLNDFYPPSMYDVAVLSNVLEHSTQPESLLKHSARILRPGGVLLISCPHARSWQRTVFGKFWINWHVPFHISHFTQHILAKILNEAGFKIVLKKQKSPSLWVSQSIISRLFAEYGQATTQLRNAILVAGVAIIVRFLFFPLLWVGNIVGRGDCLLLVAKKD